MLYKQFAKPEGSIGKITGWFMVKENERRNEWTLSFLDIQKNDKVLEVGFGPADALKKIAGKEGITLYGIDPSESMVETALRRLKKEKAAEQICMMQGEAQMLEDFYQPLDKIYSINNISFWETPVKTLNHLHSLLRPGGRIALTLSPHGRGTSDETTEVMGGQLRALLEESGFNQIEVFIKPTFPNDTVCALGMKK
ncbi:class I SAM-dependent methyltransferase [Halobacillus sp. B29]|uniref:class I SAM-dependent methyltransferase n=1 Tax=Halobacillus sp. B29 TaxID=3457432 RepID=UPI003FCE0DC1